MTDKAQRGVVGSLGMNEQETAMLNELANKWGKTPYEAVRTAIAKEYKRCKKIKS